MRESRKDTDYVEQVRELNRLFLSYLKHEGNRCGVSAGLSEKLQALVRSADTLALERAAQLPFALFTVELSLSNTKSVRESRREHATNPALEALLLTIVLSLWNLCFRRRSLVRTFFGLDDRSIALLRHINLSDVPTIARSATIVTKQFPRAAWFWQALLDEEQGNRGHLDLIALQPRAAEARIGS